MAALLIVLLTVGFVLAQSGPTKEPRPAGSNFVRLLSLVPDTPETRFDVMVVDYDRLFGSLDVKRPRSTLTDEDNDHALAAMGAGWRDGFNLAFGYDGVMGVLSAFGPYSLALSTPSALGYGLSEVDGYVFAGREPSGYEAVVGHFNARRVNEKLSRCDDCGLDPVFATHAGTLYVAWGNDFQRNLRHRLTAPAFDEFGVGGRLAATPSYVLRTQWSAGMEQMLDAAGGRGKSLADDPDIVLIAKALDDMHAVSAYISYCTWSRPRVEAALKEMARATVRQVLPEADEALYGQIEATLNSARGDVSLPDRLLEAYQAYSVASGIHKNEPYTALLLMNATPEQAQANGGLLRDRLASTRPMGLAQWPDASKVDISVKGRLVIATFPRAISPSDVLWSFTLLAHE